MSVTIGIAGKNDATGWTVITPSSPSADTGTPAGSRLVYVSSSTGNDTTGDGSQANPYATIKKGGETLRNNKPDWLLLKKGDVWTDDGFGPDSNGFLQRSGLSATEPMVITSYGTGARPLIRCGENKRILASNGPPSLYDYIALIDIEARCYIGDPSDPGYLGANGSRSAGIEVGWPGAHWFLVEGCKFQFFAGVNLGEQDPRVIGSTGPRFGTVYWRRNVITECWGSKQFGGTGIVGNSWLNVYFHDNIWNECANSPRGDASWIMPPGDPTAWSATPPVGPANSHNIYWNFGNYITEFKNNISTNAQYNNYKSRGATNITNSFFARGSQATEQKSGVAATANIGEFGYYTGGTVCNDNVCIEQRSQYWPGSGHSDAGGSGFWFLGYDTPVGISPFEGKRNLIANSQLYNVDGIGITIGAGCVNSTITDNVIFKCFQGIQDLGTGNITSPNKIDLDGDNAEFSFPSPNNAFLGKYNVSLGGADDFDAFMLEACKQSKDNWHPAYTAPAINDFMRRQFGMAELGVDGGLPLNTSRSQMNLNFMNGASDYCMINRILAGDIDLHGNTPDILDANGWPTSMPPGNSINFGWTMEDFSEYSGLWILDWLGTGSLSLSGGSYTPFDGSLSGTNGRYRFTNGLGTHFLFISITATNPAPNNLRRVRCYRADEETLLAAGEYFSPPFLAKLSSTGCGTLRFLKWQGQFGNTTAATRKPVSYGTYSGYQWRSDLYCGISSNVGNDFTCAAPATWPGLVDKATIHVKWNASMTNEFTTLKVGTTAVTPIRHQNGKTTYFDGVNGVGPGVNCVATLVYDGTLNVWILIGGNLNGTNITQHGINDGVPWEVMIALANKVNMHPWFTSPYLATYPMTDYMPGLAQLCHDTLKGGLIPHFEGINEPWNTGGDTPVQWLLNIGEALWGPINNSEDPLGMTLSTMGQAVSAIYGNDRSKYEIVAGVHTDAGEGTANYVDFILNSPQYVAHGGSAAVYWVTVLAAANYFRETLTSTQISDMEAAFAVADTAGKATIANDFAASAFNEGTFGLPQIKRHFQGWVNYSKTKGVPLKVKCYEGGYSPDPVDALKSASKDAPVVGPLTTQNYADVLATGAISPSQFTFCGPANDSWSVLRPDLYGTLNAQFLAIQAFNASVVDTTPPPLGPMRYIAFAM